MTEVRKRQKAIRFRVTPAEQNCIKTAARKASIPLASFARQAVLAASNNEAIDTFDSKARALRDILSEIQQIGAVTRKRVVTSRDADRLEFELRRLQRLLFRFHYEPADGAADQ